MDEEGETLLDGRDGAAVCDDEFFTLRARSDSLGFASEAEALSFQLASDDFDFFLGSELDPSDLGGANHVVALEAELVSELVDDFSADHRSGMAGLEVLELQSEERVDGVLVEFLELRELVEIEELLLAESAKIEESDELGETHRSFERFHESVEDFHAVDAASSFDELLLSAVFEEVVDVADAADVDEVVDERVASAANVEHLEEFSEHVDDLLLAVDVLALDEARVSDSEIALADRALGGEVDRLLDVFGEDRVVVEHVAGPLLSFTSKI